MRLILPSEMNEMWEKIEPYLVVEGLNVKLKEDTPEEIVELHRVFSERRKKLYDEVKQDIMG